MAGLMRSVRASMKRILLTGMSGVGKSTVISQLEAKGYKAIDVDDLAWSEWADSVDGEGPSPLHQGKDWVWREGRIQSLLATEDVDVLIVSGCASNQARFHEQFDYIVLLSAPAAVMVERLTDRERRPLRQTSGGGCPQFAFQGNSRAEAEISGPPRDRRQRPAR